MKRGRRERKKNGVLRGKGRNRKGRDKRGKGKEEDKRRSDGRRGPLFTFLATPLWLDEISVIIFAYYFPVYLTI